MDRSTQYPPDDERPRKDGFHIKTTPRSARYSIVVVRVVTTLLFAQADGSIRWISLPFPLLTLPY